MSSSPGQIVPQPILPQSSSTNVNRVRVHPVNPGMVARLRDPRVARAMLQQQQQEQQLMQQQQQQHQEHMARMELQQQQATFMAKTRIPMRTVAPIDPLTSSEQHAQILAELDIGAKDIREQRQRIAHKSVPTRSASVSNARSSSTKPISPVPSNSRPKVSPRGTTKSSGNSTKSSSSIRERSERSSRSDSKSTTRRTSSDGNSTERKKIRTNSSSSTKGDQRSPKRSTSDSATSNADSSSPTKNARARNSLDSTAVDEKSKDNTSTVYIQFKRRPDLNQQHQLKPPSHWTHGQAATNLQLVVFSQFVAHLISLFIRMKLDVNSVGDQIPQKRCRLFIVLFNRSLNAVKPFLGSMVFCCMLYIFDSKSYYKLKDEWDFEKGFPFKRFGFGMQLYFLLSGTIALSLHIAKVTCV